MSRDSELANELILAFTNVTHHAHIFETALDFANLWGASIAHYYSSRAIFYVHDRFPLEHNVLNRMSVQGRKNRLNCEILFSFCNMQNLVSDCWNSAPKSIKSVQFSKLLPAVSIWPWLMCKLCALSCYVAVLHPPKFSRWIHAW